MTTRNGKQRDEPHQQSGIGNATASGTSAMANLLHTKSARGIVMAGSLATPTPLDATMVQADIADTVAAIARSQASSSSPTTSKDISEVDESWFNLSFHSSEEEWSKGEQGTNRNMSTPSQTSLRQRTSTTTTNSIKEGRSQHQRRQSHHVNDEDDNHKEQNVTISLAIGANKTRVPVVVKASSAFSPKETKKEKDDDEIPSSSSPSEKEKAAAREMEEEVDENAFSMALGPPPSSAVEETVSLLQNSHQMRQDINQLQMDLFLLKHSTLGSGVGGPGSSVLMGQPHVYGHGDDVEQPLSNDNNSSTGHDASRHNVLFPWLNPTAMSNVTPNEKDELMESLPEDSFSIMLVSSTCSVSFATAFMVFAVQITTFLLLTLNETSSDWSDVIPANVIPSVRITQIIAVTITVMTQDDVRIGISLLYKGYTNNLRNAFDGKVSCLKWIVNTLMRIVEGALGLIVTFLLIVVADTVVGMYFSYIV